MILLDLETHIPTRKPACVCHDVMNLLDNFFSLLEASHTSGSVDINRSSVDGELLALYFPGDREEKKKETAAERVNINERQNGWCIKEPCIYMCVHTQASVI